MTVSALQSQRCPVPRQIRSSYCFGEIHPEERLTFEAHLLECDSCWREIQRLDSAITLLRSDHSLIGSELAGATVGSLGISAKFDQLFGGHLWHVLIASALYASLYAISVGIEIAYEFDSFRYLSYFGAPLVFVWILASSCFAFYVLHFQLRQNRQRGLTWAFLVLLGAAGIAFAGVTTFLPNRPITQASFQTYAAPAAYLKDVIYFLPVAIFFLLLPANLVLGLQRELTQGRARLVCNLLAGERSAVAPRGVIYPRFWFLGLVFFLMLAISLPMMSHLLDGLLASRYSQLFQLLIWLRLGSFLILGLKVLGWYHEMLDELKREAMASTALDLGLPGMNS